MTILCLTGWQQPTDALAIIAPQAAHYDYASHTNIQSAFATLPPEPQLAIGWSLGGHLLVQAVAGGYCRPKKLLLLGAPFQCVASEHFPEGMPTPMFQEFRTNYQRSPEETTKRFPLFIAQGDRYASRIVQTLGHTPVWQNGLFWLDVLGSSSCHTLDFSAFPHTIIVHGANDQIIRSTNAAAFAARLPSCELLLWPDCGHAPHLHNPDAIREIVAKHV